MGEELTAVGTEWSQGSRRQEGSLLFQEVGQDRGSCGGEMNRMRLGMQIPNGVGLPRTIEKFAFFPLKYPSPRTVGSDWRFLSRRVTLSLVYLKQFSLEVRLLCGEEIQGQKECKSGVLLWEGMLFSSRWEVMLSGKG